MRISFFFSTLLFILTGCNQEPVVKHHPLSNPLKSKSGKDNIGNFRNPVLMFGSSFLEYFAILKQTNPGNLDTLIYFTSTKSLREHGREKILHLYKTTNFNFKKKLAALRKENDSTYVMNYKCSIIATNSMKSISVTIENDTCRLLLPQNLDDFLQ